MKNRNILYKAAAILIASLALLVMTGCNNITTDSIENNGKAKVTFSIGELPRIINANYEAQQLTDFVLTAAAQNATASQAGTWATYSALTQAEVELVPGTYTFNLSAKKGVFVYKGSVTKELSVENTNTINFKLALDYNATAAAITEAGSVPEGNGAVDVYIYYIDSTESVNTQIKVSDSNTVIDSKTNADIAPVDGTGEYADYKLIHYVNDSIAYGLYNLDIELLADGKKNWRKEQILVCPDLTVKATYVIDEYVPIHTVTYEFQAEGMDSYEQKYIVGNTHMDVLSLDDEALEDYDFSKYVFSGWYRNAECTGQSVTEINTLEDSEDFTLYAKWQSVSSRHISVEKCDEGIKVKAYWYSEDGTWNSCMLKEDVTGIAIMYLRFDTAPTSENPEVEYIYPFTQEGETYSFTFIPDMENINAEEEHVSCEAGGGDLSLFTINDDFTNAEICISDTTWGEPYKTNYKLSTDICSIFNNVDSDHFKSIRMFVNFFSGEQDFVDATFAGTKNIDYFSTSEGLTVDEYNSFLAGDTYVSQSECYYDILLERDIWSAWYILYVELPDNDAVYDFKCIGTQAIFAPVQESVDDLVVIPTDNGFEITSFSFKHDNNSALVYLDGSLIFTLSSDTFQPCTYSFVEPGEEYTFSFVQYKSSDYGNPFTIPEEYLEQHMFTKDPIQATGGSGEVSIENFDDLEAIIDWTYGTVGLNEVPVITGVDTEDVISYSAVIYNQYDLPCFVGEGEDIELTGYAWITSWLEEYEVIYSVYVNDEQLPQVIRTTVKNPLIGKKFTYYGEEYVFTKDGIVSTSADYVKDNKCSLYYLSSYTSNHNGYNVDYNGGYPGFYVLINRDGAPFARCLGEDEIFISYLSLDGHYSHFDWGNTYPLYDAYDSSEEEVTLVTFEEEPEDIHVTMTAQGNTLNISVPEEFTDVEWEIFGTTLTGNSHSIDISSKSSGNYECFVLGTKEGIEYSEYFIFTLTKE